MLQILGHLSYPCHALTKRLLDFLKLGLISFDFLGSSSKIERTANVADESFDKIIHGNKGCISSL